MRRSIDLGWVLDPRDNKKVRVAEVGETAWMVNMVERGEEEVRVWGLRGGRGIEIRRERGARVHPLEGMEIVRQDMVGIVSIEALLV
jgi:hypothetical protein